MKMIKNLFTAALLCMTIGLYAQSGDKPIWIGAGYSYPIYAELLPENVEYKAHLTRLYASYAPFYHNFWRRLSFYAEPQFAQVRLTTPDGEISESNETDAGLNLGVRFDWLTLEKIWGYVFIGAGPHYMSTETALQADGFIFSDNIGAGFFIPIPNTKLDIGIEGRFRHMSNAGLDRPNGGVDNVFLGIGVFYKPNWNSGCHCPKF